MDWFSWLSKTCLEPSLVYEYGLAFSQNELEQDDLAYFNHEFLQSMGISIAKHRLEIIKLARKEKGTTPHSMSRILIVIKRTKSQLSKYLHSWIFKREESSLTLVPRRSYSGEWKTNMLKRNKKSMVASHQNKTPFFLTSGRELYFPSGRTKSFSSSSVHEFGKEEDQKIDGDDVEYWHSAVDEIRWDTMFQNLKPN